MLCGVLSYAGTRQYWTGVCTISVATALSCIVADFFDIKHRPKVLFKHCVEPMLGISDMYVSSVF